MRYALIVWPEAWKDFQAKGLPYQDTPKGLIGDYNSDQIIGLSDHFDLMMRTKDGEKTITVAPLGRGFNQR
jgi:hypothetical protein